MNNSKKLSEDNRINMKNNKNNESDIKNYCNKFHNNAINKMNFLQIKKDSSLANIENLKNFIKNKSESNKTLIANEKNLKNLDVFNNDKCMNHFYF